MASTITYKLLNGDSDNPQVVPAKYREIHVVARDDAAEVYRVFADYYKLLEYIQENAAPMLHEVIFNCRAQKLKFDLDVPTDELMMATLDDEPITEETIIETMRTGIISAFHSSYNIMLDAANIVICKNQPLETSLGADKCSLHFIINKYAVESNQIAFDFMKETLNIIPYEISKWVDRGVYKSIQNFRLPGAVRNNRIKRILSDHKPLDCCIGYVEGCQIVGQTINPPTAQPGMNIASDDIQRVLTVCADAGILTAHKFKNYNNGVLSFRRQHPDFCKLCKRVHDKDNTLMIILVPRGNKLQILQKCRHNETDSVEIGEMLVEGLNVPINTENASARSKRLDRIIQTFKPATLNLAGITQNVYTAEQLADYELVPTLIVHAPMKMGKTKKLKEYLRAHYADTDIIRFVSFRQTFSNSIKSSFPEFQLYTDVNGEIHDKRVIIQVESLWRLSCIEPPMLLILDECESIFEQFDSGLGGQLGCNFAILQYMMRYSRRVVLMDAFITERTLNIVRKMRGGDIHYHRNTFSRDVDMIYAFTVDRATWLNKLTEVIRQNERVAIPVNSLTDGKSIQQFLIEKFSSLNLS